MYIRGNGGDTREARAHELDQLILRGQRKTTAVMACSVEIQGLAYPVHIDNAQTIDRYVSAQTKALRAAIPEKRPAPTQTPPQGSVGSPLNATGQLKEIAAMGTAWQQLQEQARAPYKGLADATSSLRDAITPQPIAEDRTRDE